MSEVIFIIEFFSLDANDEKKTFKKVPLSRKTGLKFSSFILISSKASEWAYFRRTSDEIFVLLP